MDRVSGVMAKLGMEEGQPIEHGTITKSIERAQKRVEEQNFNIRKHLLKYDDVMNKQREAIYTLRKNILMGENNADVLMEFVGDILTWMIDTYTPEDKSTADRDQEGLRRDLIHYFGIYPDAEDLEQISGMNRDELHGFLVEKARDKYERKADELGEAFRSNFARAMMLQVLDKHWRDHLYGLDHLREGIGLRGYAQKDPLVEYKRESFEMFQLMNEKVKEDIVRFMYHFQPIAAQERASEQPRRDEMHFSSGNEGEAPRKQKTVKRKQPKVGRNAPCPCGSGKKYKKCCGA
jgi:preprotein translocase subunit SecA